MAEVDELRAEIARLRSVIDRAATLLHSGYGLGKLEIMRIAGAARKLLREAVPVAGRDREHDPERRTK